MLSEWEATFLILVREAGLPEPEREYIPIQKRRWRLDFAYPEMRIGIEIEGGIWNFGRHTRPKGYEDDCTKYNEISMAGWMILRFTPGMIQRGEAITTLKRAMIEKRKEISSSFLNGAAGGGYRNG